MATRSALKCPETRSRDTTRASREHNHNMTTATETNRATRISWYRTPISRDLLNELNQRSDWRGLVQTVGFLGVLTLTGAGAWFASVRLSWPWFLLALLAHGTVYGFVIRGSAGDHACGARRACVPRQPRPSNREMSKAIRCQQ